MPPTGSTDWPRSILRCPACLSTLVDGSGPDGAELHCVGDAPAGSTDVAADSCRRAYRVDDGVPVLLVHEARTVDA